MSFIDRRRESRPDRGEAPFRLDEVFFSRTDARGVIRAGNYVFHRVAGYAWTELLGAPHKLVRHPDMPRAVFWLMWNQIQQGRPIGAYVKNRARDGLAYWVFAVVAPCRDGYLSARIKPTSTLRATIEQEYAAVRAAELTENLKPEDSAARLVARLGALGFDSYDHFATHALNAELKARDAGLGHDPDRQLARFDRMQKAAHDLREQTEALAVDFHAMRTIPHNMQVIASRLEPTGGPVSTLSKNYRAISTEMADWFETNVVGTGSTSATVFDSVGRCGFLEAVVRILKECDQQLGHERRGLGSIDLGAERQVLAQVATDLGTRATEGIGRVRSEAERVLRACVTMNRHVLGLSTTRILCKIESGRLPESGDGLKEIISQLSTFQERIGSRLERIASAAKEILDSIG